jgi:hypothetical protein
MPGSLHRGFAMQAAFGVVFGIMIGAVVLATVGRGITARAAPRPGPTALGWCALAFGLLALAAIGLAMARVPVVGNARVSIELAAAAMVISIGAVVKRDRHWPTWVGFAVGAIPALFWVAFALGEVFGPRH